jgi:general secretion pathway protein C
VTIQRAVVILNVLLLTLGAYFLVGLGYRVLALQIQPQDTQITALSPSEHSQRDNSTQPVSYYDAILDRDLFKTQKAAQNPTAAVNLENLEQTQLKLKLLGTVAGDEENTYAVIEDTPKRTQDLYRVGDGIQNATVKLILRSKVVLTLNGKDEILAMDDVPLGAVRAEAPMASTPPFRQPESGEGGEMEQRVSLRREMINEAMQDVSKLASEIAIVPYMENGQPNGLALNNIKPNSIFRQMGLRNGDILMGVDGNPIRTVEDALRLYDSLKQSNNVNLQLKRRGQERTINYNIR